MADALLLNSGLDNICSLNSNRIFTDSNLYGMKAFQYLAVGTGSTAPDASQTLLDAETHRVNATGGFPSDALSSVNVDKLERTVTTTRVIDFAASYNLTEYAWTPNSSGGPHTIRDLFRDGSDNPTTVSVQDGQQLQMTLTVTWVMDFAAEAYSFDITGIGTISGSGTLFSSSTGFYNTTFYQYAHPLPNTTFTFLVPTTGAGISTSPTDSVAIGEMSSAVIASSSRTDASYTNGTFYRDRSYKFLTSQGNGNITGFVESTVASTTSTKSNGYKFILSSPSSITKASTHELTLTRRITVSRL